MFVLIKLSQKLFVTKILPLLACLNTDIAILHCQSKISKDLIEAKSGKAMGRAEETQSLIVCSCTKSSKDSIILNKEIQFHQNIYLCIFLTLGICQN